MIVKDGAIWVKLHDFKDMIEEGVVDDCSHGKVDIFLYQFANDLQKLQLRCHSILRFILDMFFTFHK